jgi:zinc protease
MREKSVAFGAAAALAASLSLGAAPSPVAGASPAEAPAPVSGGSLEFARHLLPNGLTILLAEERSQPLVSVAAWYRVGARNEGPGITGIAHFVEHMGFRATENISGADVFGHIERLGGHWHGYTRHDNTIYYETARREALDWLLFLEAERLRRCRILPQEVEIERGSILAEHDGYENDPWSLLFDDVAAAAFREHPYGYNISGWSSDLKGIRPADVRDFYDRHYVPANLILAVVGDFDSARALASIRRHFGALPRRAGLEPLRTVEPPQRGERRVTLRMPGAAATVMVAHRSPALTDPDFFPFLVLDALLGGGRPINTLDNDFELSPLEPERRTSRLYRSLVSTGLASRASTGFLPTLHPYLHTVIAEASDGVEPAALERAMVAAVEELAARGPAEEEIHLARGRLIRLSALAADTYQEVVHLRAQLEGLGAGDLWGRIEERISAVQASEVQAAARRYLTSDSRTVGLFLPRATSENAAAEYAASSESTASGSGAAGVAGAKAMVRSSGGAAAKIAPPSITFVETRPPPPPLTVTLPSGLRLAASANPWVSTAALVIEMDAGPYYDPPGGEGTAALVARSLPLAGAPPSGGDAASFSDRHALRWSVEVGGTDFDHPDPRRVRLSAQFSAADLEEVAAFLAASLSTPRFAADEVRVARSAQAAEVAAIADDTDGLARSRLQQALFAGTPFGRPPLGTVQSVAALSRSGLQDFHRRRYRPERARIAFAGGVGATQALASLERAFAAWSPATGPAESATAPSPPSTRPHAPDPVRLPHKSQVDLAYGFFTGVEAGSADRRAFEALWYVVQHGYYSGRLGETIVGGRGLAYSIESRPALDLPGAPVLMATGVSPEKVEELRRLWEQTLDEVATRGITARELEAARTWIDGRALHTHESNLSAALAALDALAGRATQPAVDASVAGKRAHAAPILTLTQVNALARRILGARKGIWSAAGPLP